MTFLDPREWITSLHKEVRSCGLLSHRHCEHALLQLGYRAGRHSELQALNRYGTNCNLHSQIGDRREQNIRSGCRKQEC
jgi:hypothetical protein